MFSCLIISGIFPPDIGGPASYVSMIADALSEKGYDILVLTLSDNVDLIDNEYQFKIIRLQRNSFKPFRWIKTIKTIIKIGRTADVLFVNGLAMEAVLANLFLRKPLVQKVVGDLAWERSMTMGWVVESFEEFQNQQHGIKIEFLKILRSWWTRRSNKLIVPSKYLARYVKRWGIPEDRIHVIYNSVNVSDTVQPATIPLDANLKIVTVGRLVSWKRFSSLIEAISKLNDVGLVIVGDGPDRPELEALTKRLRVRERVYFAGQRSKTETLNLMCACNIFVLNSSYEGLPHVILEAMSLCLPIVATDVGGISEVISNGESGFLIDFSKNSEELALVLKDLIKRDDLRALLAKNGRLHVLKNFCVSRTIQETEEILKSEHQSKVPA